MMKKLLTVLITAATMVGAMAEVPSLINYQGRLKEKSGSNVNGTKNFTVRIFDAKTGGKQIYEENVGAVTINEGAYSFGFGEAGQSILDFSESLIVEEAAKQIFDFTLSRTPVAESLSIQAGDFAWSEKTGSSDSDNLLVQYDKNNKSVKIIFLNGSPGKDAALKFDCLVEESGVMEALASSQSSWLEIAVGGETLSPRERLISVPFAMHSKSSEKAKMSTMVLESFSDHVSQNRFVQSQPIWSKRIFVPKEVEEIEAGMQVRLYAGGLDSVEPAKFVAEFQIDFNLPTGRTTLTSGPQVVDPKNIKFNIKNINLIENQYCWFSLVIHDRYKDKEYVRLAGRHFFPLFYILGK